MQIVRIISHSSKLITRRLVYQYILKINSNYDKKPPFSQWPQTKKKKAAIILNLKSHKY